MIEVALPGSDKSQRLVNAGTVDEAGFGRGRRAVVGDFFDLQHNVFGIVNVMTGFSDGVTVETVDDLLFNPPAEGVVFEGDDAAVGAVGAAYFDQAVLGIPLLSPGFAVLLAAGQLVAVVVVAVSELAPFRHLVGVVVIVGVAWGIDGCWTGEAVADAVVGEGFRALGVRSVEQAVEGVVAVVGGCPVFAALQTVAELVELWVGDAEDLTGRGGINQIGQSIGVVVTVGGIYAVGVTQAAAPILAVVAEAEGSRFSGQAAQPVSAVVVVNNGLAARQGNLGTLAEIVVTVTEAVTATVGDAGHPSQGIVGKVVADIRPGDVGQVAGGGIVAVTDNDTAGQGLLSQTVELVVLVEDRLAVGVGAAGQVAPAIFIQVTGDFTKGVGLFGKVPGGAGFEAGGLSRRVGQAGELTDCNFAPQKNFSSVS